MRLTLLILLAMAMTGCETMRGVGRVTGAMLQGAGQGMQASANTPDQKRQLECTPTMEMNGNSRVLDCQ